MTLSGGHTNRIFDVGPGMSLTLTTFTPTDGNESLGGALLNVGDLLVLDNVIIRSSAASSAGGALSASSGTTLILNGLLEDNNSDYGCTPELLRRLHDVHESS